MSAIGSCKFLCTPPTAPATRFVIARRPKADVAISGRQLRFRQKYPVIRPGSARFPRRFAPRNDNSDSLAPPNHHCNTRNCRRRSLSAATDAIGVYHFNGSQYESGVQEKVIFLGYPDGTQLYVGKKAFSFSSGWDHTYAGKGFKDYHFDRFGTHAKYTAENMVDDIESVVLEYRPDYILAIDFDTHTDHRGVSISFEKAMERILKKESGYTPKVFKCFGYSLAWKSKPDFYALNIKSTVMQDREKNNDPSYETDVPQYRWNNRIRLPIDKKSLSHSILRCSEYKALSEHLSQYAYCYSERIINGDSVYWNRRTDSLTYNADISVSSGDASLLNDFRLIGVGNRTAGPNVKLENCVSRFNKNDAQKTVTVKFDSPKTVSCVSLYDNFGLNSNILGGVITFSDGSKVEVPALNADGSETRVVFEPKHNITSFTFKVTEYEGVAGLDEIEAFENADYDMGFSLDRKSVV